MISLIVVQGRIALLLVIGQEEHVAEESDRMCGGTDTKNRSRGQKLDFEEQKDHEQVEGNAKYVHDGAPNILRYTLRLDDPVGRIEQSHRHLEQKKHVVNERLVLEVNGGDRHGDEGSEVKVQRQA